MHDQEQEQLTTITASTSVRLPLHPQHPSYEQLNPKSHADEFLGPPGALAVTVFTPLISYLLFFGCREATGCPPSPASILTYGLSGDTWLRAAEQVLDYKAWAVYTAWYAFMVGCWAVLPGDWVEGTICRDGKRVLYKINGECEEEGRRG